MATVLFALGWNSEVTFCSDGLALGLSSVLTGCVFTEQWLRFRDHRSQAAEESARAAA
jgi:hypothetical protein